jgi:hypothetical protein
MTTDTPVAISVPRWAVEEFVERGINHSMETFDAFYMACVRAVGPSTRCRGCGLHSVALTVMGSDLCPQCDSMNQARQQAEDVERWKRENPQ